MAKKTDSEPTTSFTRRLPQIDRLRAMANPAAPSNWWQDLLRAYAPAGSKTTSDRFLRLAVRNNYLNFYRKGQSVALVRFGRGASPQLQTHIKYAFPGATGQGLALLVDRTTEWNAKEKIQSAQYEGTATLRAWSLNAEEYAGSEKEGIEAIIDRNDSIIDLEMGIPAWPEQNEDSRRTGNSRKFAPRMDIVALELCEGRPTVVFWEAKCLRDSRLRSASGSPEVLAQLKLYESFLKREAYRRSVALAYQENCKLLLELHLMASQLADTELPMLSDLVLQVANSPTPPDVDMLPRLVIFPGRNKKTCRLETEPRGWVSHYETLLANVSVMLSNDPSEILLASRPYRS